MKERLTYLLVIGCLLGLIGYEFEFFTKHYEILEKQLDYVMSHCK